MLRTLIVDAAELASIGAFMAAILFWAGALAT